MGRLFFFFSYLCEDWLQRGDGCAAWVSLSLSVRFQPKMYALSHRDIPEEVTRAGVIETPRRLETPIDMPPSSLCAVSALSSRCFPQVQLVLLSLKEDIQSARPSASTPTLGIRVAVWLGEHWCYGSSTSDGALIFPLLLGVACSMP